MSPGRWRFLWCAAVAAFLLAGCRDSTAERQSLKLATTTSTQDSGLLDVLLSKFEQETGIAVKVIAVGSGQAIELGRRGDVDVLLTHAPAAEEEFVRDGFGERRIPVFHNDFLLVGPGEQQPDETMSLDAFLQRIVTEDLPFISRADDSGTHRKEQALWDAVSLTPAFSNYLRAGAGMAQTLRIANEKRALTLTDRATYLALAGELDLQILVEGDPRLINPYAVIVVNPAKHPHANAAAARQFAGFLTSETGRRIVAGFGKEQFGQPLFFPEPDGAKVEP